MVSANEFFDYGAKYNGESQEITPARLPEDTAERVRLLTSAIYDILGCSGLIRIDYNVSHHIFYIQSCCTHLLGNEAGSCHARSGIDFEQVYFFAFGND